MIKNEFALLVSDAIREANTRLMNFESAVKIREDMIQKLDKLVLQFVRSEGVNDFTAQWAINMVAGVKAIPPTDNKDYSNRLVVKYLELGLARRKMVEQIHRVGRK